MILEYHRPKTIEQTLQLLARSQPPTVLMGGGTITNQPGGDPRAVIDLQDLGLSSIRLQGNRIVIGATTTLQQMIASSEMPGAVRKAINQETSFNLRQVGTLAGTLVSASGSSPVATIFFALDAVLIWAPGDREVLLGSWYALRPAQSENGLITSIQIPIVNTVFHAVARTPNDRPLVCVAAAAWPGGRVRIALGGFGSEPVLIADGRLSVGVEKAAKNAYIDAGDDWATAEYRSSIAGVLARRCLNELEQQ